VIRRMEVSSRHGDGKRGSPAGIGMDAAEEGLSEVFGRHGVPDPDASV